MRYFADSADFPPENEEYAHRAEIATERACPEDYGDNERCGKNAPRYVKHPRVESADAVFEEIEGVYAPHSAGGDKPVYDDSEPQKEEEILQIIKMTLLYLLFEADADYVLRTAAGTDPAAPESADEYREKEENGKCDCARRYRAFCRRHHYDDWGDEEHQKRHHDCRAGNY